MQQKFAPGERFAGLCGQFPFPCGQNSFRAAIFPSVRRFSDPCGRSSDPCEPTPRPCGDFSICAAVFRFVRAKSHVFEAFGEFRWSKSGSYAFPESPVLVMGAGGRMDNNGEKGRDGDGIERQRWCQALIRILDFFFVIFQHLVRKMPKVLLPSQVGNCFV